MNWFERCFHAPGPAFKFSRTRTSRLFLVCPFVALCSGFVLVSLLFAADGDLFSVISSSSMQRFAEASSEVDVSGQVVKDTDSSDSSERSSHLPYTTQPFPDWCPVKYCERRPSLCQQQFMFVISTGGRTGSTTLMNALNALPNVWISGETRHMIADLRTAFRKTVPYGRRNDTWIDGSTTVNAWYRARIDRETVLRAVQDFVKQTCPPPSNRRNGPSVVGLKDISWEVEDLPFMQEAMPCSKFVFSYRRDIAQQSKSNWHSHDKQALPKLLNHTRDIFLARKRMWRPSFAMPVEDFNPANFTRLARWVGSSCTFHRISHHNSKKVGKHGSQPGIPAVCS